SGDFSLMDRRVVDVLNAMPERPRFVRGMRGWAGFRQSGVPCDRGDRFAGRTKHTYRMLVRLALDGFFGFSNKPLQLASALGIAVSGASFALALALVFLKLAAGVPLPGTTAPSSAFVAGDFKVFDVSGFKPRMSEIRTRVRPKLDAIGETLAPAVSRSIGGEVFVHVARHARRTVIPPDDTWVAFGPDARG